jgi:proteasome assembly chaperone (PAC2) family protein
MKMNINILTNVVVEPSNINTFVDLYSKIIGPPEVTIRDQNLTENTRQELHISHPLN